MNLDLRTVVAAIAVTLSVVTIGMIVSSRSYPEHVRRSVHLWSLASGLQSVGWLLFVGRGLIPNALSIVVANALLSLSIAMFEDAIRGFQRLDATRWLIYTPPAVVFVLFVYFGIIAPNFTVRVMLVSAIVGIQMMRCAWLLLRRIPGERLLAGRLAAAGFVIAGVTLLARAVVAATSHAPADTTNMFQRSPVEQVAFLVLFMSVFMLSFGFLLMCTESFTHDLVRLATLDSLTHLYNRRTIEDLARREISAARRSGSQVSLAMLDLDNLKQVNDTHGHAAGDDAVRDVGERASAHLRARDLIGRYGGDEFLIVMPDTGVEQAYIAAERLRAEIYREPVTVEGHAIKLTASIGLATSPAGAHDLDALVKLADRALYAAKAAGRNRTSTGATD